MPKERIKEGWESYREHVISDMAPKEQLDECKMAFFGGATWLLNLLVSNADEYSEVSGEPTEEEMKIMDEIADELQTFADATGEGYVPQ